MSTQLEQLKEITTVVADTGDFKSIIEFKPTDATTNPSLLLSASSMSEYAHLLNDAIECGKKASSVNAAMDKLLVNFGLEILKIIPGRVSIEVDAHLSFDQIGTIERAKHIIQLFEAAGIDRKRILIKVAATWEGIQAAHILETQHAIHCNLTLIFSYAQAIACADAGVTLISPFVGRILDWYTKNVGGDLAGDKDPGVKSVKAIYQYFKKYGYHTVVMGASFRNVDEIRELAGIDYLTISPALMKELHNDTSPLTRKLDFRSCSAMDIPRVKFDEKAFRWALNEDAMATDKLAEGIRKFSADGDKLRKMIEEKMK